MFTLRKCSNLFASLMIAALLALAIAGAVPAVTAPAIAAAAVWYVKPLGNDANTCKTPALACKTINAAIGKAGFFQTIKVAVGTYTATTGAQVVLVNKHVKLLGGWNGTFTAQTGRSIIDGKNLRRGVTIPAPWEVTLDHFQIQNGHANPGGGISNLGVLTLSNSTTTRNWAPAGAGGGIWSGGPLTVNTSTVSYNTGGGIRSTVVNVNNSGVLTINSSIISHNALGAGIRTSDEKATINNSNISYNSAIGLQVPAYADVNNSTLDHNSPMAIQYTGVGMTVNGSTISNTTGRGISSAGPLTITNSTVSGTVGNVAYPDGSGIISLVNATPYTRSGISLYSTTVSNNSTGIRVDGGTAYLANTIVAGNSSDGVTPNDCAGTLNSSGYNLIGSASTCTFIGFAGDLTGTAEAPIDPKLAPLQDNGGPFLTHAVLPGSPAIDAGNPAAPGTTGSNVCPAADERGYVRPGQSACDIGAYEYYPSGIYSSTRIDGDPTSAGTVHFAVIFSGHVTGVDVTDFALTTTGTVTGAAVTAVAGAGESYTVTVNTGSGDGTLRLDLVDDDSILDAYTGEPIGGVGTGNADFTSGEAYAIANPWVVSVNPAAANPTSAAVITYRVTFSTAVTGVNMAAPFPDFLLTSDGLDGAQITAVAGSGKTYTVTVNHGLGSGTLRLDVVDDDTIQDPTSGRILGGVGLANGDFTSGQAFDIVPMPQAPGPGTWDTTPTFTWAKLAGVTQYQYQLLNGAAPVYSYLVPSTACTTTTCSHTPSLQLAPASTYSWSVQAYYGDAWRDYSPAKPFTLKAPVAGLWASPYSWVSFYVAPNRVQVTRFTAYIRACNKNWAITHLPAMKIDNGGFQFGGAQQSAGGSFDVMNLEPTIASGDVSFYKYVLPGCGAITGWAQWDNYWLDSSQPAIAGVQPQMNLLVMPMPDAPLHLYVPFIASP